MSLRDKLSTPPNLPLSWEEKGCLPLIRGIKGVIVRYLISFPVGFQLIGIFSIGYFGVGVLGSCYERIKWRLLGEFGSGRSEDIHDSGSYFSLVPYSSS